VFELRGIPFGETEWQLLRQTLRIGVFNAKVLVKLTPPQPKLEIERH
jgi:hypothetical protein